MGLKFKTQKLQNKVWNRCNLSVKHCMWCKTSNTDLKSRVRDSGKNSK